MKNANPVDFLIDTGVLSGLLDSNNSRHELTKAWLGSLPDSCKKIVSVVALAELRFGRQLALVANRLSKLPHLDQIILNAEQFELLDITGPTASEYARLKANLAQSRVPKRIQKRSKISWGNPESWISEFSGTKLQIQENDLWQCAQAIEREIVFVTVDKGINDIGAISNGQLQILML